jgi:small conductance mechanosensitive channel
VPWGEVSGVLNMTKEFSFAVIDAGVAYREDVDQVIEVLRQVGAEMQADPEFGPLILEPLEVLGLDSFGESAVNIRVRFKTRPIQQWGVRREFNRRMKRAFDARGIEIPFPHRTLYFGVDKQGQAPAAQIQLQAAAPPDTEAAVQVPAEPQAER